MAFRLSRLLHQNLLSCLKRTSFSRFRLPASAPKKNTPAIARIPPQGLHLPTNPVIRAHFLASKRTVGSGQFQPMNSLPASNACQMTAHGGWPPEQMPPLQRAEEV